METDWIWGLVGGLMIGAAASFYLLVNGRIMGASGIIGGLVDRTGWSTWAERLAFVAGLALIPALLKPVYNVPVLTHITDNIPAVILAGLRGAGWAGRRADLLAMDVAGGPVAAAQAAAQLLARAFVVPG